MKDFLTYVSNYMNIKLLWKIFEMVLTTS